MNKPSFSSFVEETEKLASAGIGAGIGAGLAGLHGGLKEWDRRIDEDKNPSPSPETQEKHRKRRLKRLATGVALGAGAGALTGHYAAKGYAKAVNHVGEKAKELTQHAGKTLDESIDRLGKHYKEPFSGKNARKLGRNLKEGILPHPIRRTKRGVKKAWGKLKNMFGGKKSKPAPKIKKKG